MALSLWFLDRLVHSFHRQYLPRPLYCSQWFLLLPAFVSLFLPEQGFLRYEWKWKGKKNKTSDGHSGQSCVIIGLVTSAGAVWSRCFSSSTQGEICKSSADLLSNYISYTRLIPSFLSRAWKVNKKGRIPLRLGRAADGVWLGFRRPFHNCASWRRLLLHALSPAVLLLSLLLCRGSGCGWHTICHYTATLVLAPIYVF